MDLLKCWFHLDLTSVCFILSRNSSHLFEVFQFGEIQICQVFNYESMTFLGVYSNIPVFTFTFINLVKFSYTHTHTHHLCVFWLIWPSLSISWILLKNWFSVSLIPCIVYIAVTTSISTDLILKFEYFFLSTLLLSFLLVFLESD